MKIAVKAILVLLIITIGLANASLRKKKLRREGPHEKDYIDLCHKKCVALGKIYFCDEDSSYMCACTWGYSFAKHPSHHDAYENIDSTKAKDAIKNGLCHKI